MDRRQERRAAWISFSLVVAFLILLFLLHIIEPEFNALGQLISDYELGQYGVLMSLAFFCIGGSALFLAIAVGNDLQKRTGRVGVWWLVFIGIAFIGAGIFPPDRGVGLGQSMPMSFSGSLHTGFGLFVIFTAPIAFTLLYRSLIHNQQLFTMVRRLRWLTFLPWVGLASFFVSLVAYGATQHPMIAWSDLRTLVSITNRFMVLTYCVWLLFITWYMGREGKTVLQS
jgi:hypothetical protein